MKKTYHHIIFGLLLLFALPNFAQKEVKGYRIEGDEIVFSFDREDYKKATHDNYGDDIDFDDLDIKNVVVAGSFNDWSRNEWEMKKVDDGRYELLEENRRFFR